MVKGGVITLPINPLHIVIPVIVGVVMLALGVLIGYVARKKSAEATISSAEEHAKKIMDEAVVSAEAKSKEMLVEAKEEILKAKTEAERENKERRQEVIRLENRAIAKEETLDRKLENYERREEQLAQKIKDNDSLKEELLQKKADAQARLEEISGYTAETAKAELVTQIEDEAKHEAAAKLMQIESDLHDAAEEKARNIISLAIQRLASDQVSETTVSVVPLPSDEMKGRIIGREGRNIHKIETLTGVDLIIDDTPEAITLSCFDPIRREIARLTLEKLISDGRIHPTRIEETVEKARKEVELSIKRAGEEAAMETGVNGLNPELVKFLGRLKYRTSYGQNVLVHSMEVAYIAGMLANELGLDGTLAKRAGLLHDIGKSLTQEVEGSHVQLGVEIARKFKEHKEVIHAIEAHHGDVEARSVTAVLVAAADAISAARPGARREDLDNYIKRLQKLEEISNSFPGVDKSYAIQAGREIRIMVKPEHVNDDQMIVVAREIVKKIEEELEYPGQIKVNVIRESRAVDYAK
ncbi:MAG: ribonuclease Y [Clostridia bacterium]|nr:ribonuclease Y [Clostridia bacterium]